MAAASVPPLHCTVFELLKWHKSGGYNDPVALLPEVRRETIPAGVINRIEIKLLWSDQGWGNAKGKVFIHVPPVACSGHPSLPLLKQAQTWRTPNAAPHEMTEQTWTLNQDSEFVTAMNEQSGPDTRWRSNRTLWFSRHVGGGGGHQLYINEFQVRVYVASIQSAMAAFAGSNALTFKFLSGDIRTIAPGWASGGRGKVPLLQSVCNSKDDDTVYFEDELTLLPVLEGDSEGGDGREPLGASISGIGYIEMLMHRKKMLTAETNSSFTVMHKPTVAVRVDVVSGSAAATTRIDQLRVVTAAPATVGYLRRKLAAELQMPIKNVRFTHAGTSASSGRTWALKDDRKLLSDPALLVGDGSIVTVGPAKSTCIVA